MSFHATSKDGGAFLSKETMKTHRVVSNAEWRRVVEQSNELVLTRPVRGLEAKVLYEMLGAPTDVDQLATWAIEMKAKYEKLLQDQARLEWWFNQGQWQGQNWRQAIDNLMKGESNA